MKPLILIREALSHPMLFGDVLPGESWTPWKTLLIAAMGEPLTDDERIIFQKLTKREMEPLMPVEETWVIAGRRAGKTRAMSVLAAYLTCLVDWKDSLVPGERGRLFVMAQNTKQALIAFSYTKAIFENLEL